MPRADEEAERREQYEYEQHVNAEYDRAAQEEYDAAIEAARREGYIAGLEKALEIAVLAHNAYDEPTDDIRAEIERARSVQEKGAYENREVKS